MYKGSWERLESEYTPVAHTNTKLVLTNQILTEKPSLKTWDNLVGADVVEGQMLAPEKGNLGGLAKVPLNLGRVRRKKYENKEET